VQGTGLGLHIVTRYLKLMNGNIEIDSKLNRGTTFTISIPK
jgi:two-component system sensor kinase FixL